MHNRYPTFPNQPTDTILDEILEIKVQDKGIIGWLYILVSQHHHSLSIIRSQCENDLALEILDDVFYSSQIFSMLLFATGRRGDTC